MNKKLATLSGAVMIVVLGAGAWLFWPTEIERLEARAEKGEVAAQLELATVLTDPPARGIQAEADLGMAAYWLEQATEAGELNAGWQLLELYGSGAVDSGNGAKELSLLEKMAELGDAEAALEAYERLKEDEPAEARRLLNRAAELGLAEGQYTLALTLETEDAKPAEIYRWMELAAKQEHSDAQYRMGMASKDGPLAEDLGKAEEWFLKAARQGHPEGMYWTGRA